MYLLCSLLVYFNRGAMCECIVFSTLQELQAPAVMVLVWREVSAGVDGQPSSDSAWGGKGGAEVLAQSAHHLLSGGGRGLYSFHISLSLHHTTHKHRSLRCVCSEHTANAASPTQPLSEGWMSHSMTGVMTAHAGRAQHAKHLLPV